MLYYVLPATQASLLQYGQAHADNVSGNGAMIIEVILTLSAMVQMYLSSDKDAALGSAMLYLLVETVCKALWVPYLEWWYRGNPEQLKAEKKLLELRIVYEAVGEKMCIMVGPFIAHTLAPALQNDDDDEYERNTPSELAEIAGIFLLMEEVVDALGLVIMARFRIYALRVRPQLSMRNVVLLGVTIADIYGANKMAVLALK